MRKTKRVLTLLVLSTAAASSSAGVAVAAPPATIDGVYQRLIVDAAPGSGRRAHVAREIVMSNGQAYDLEPSVADRIEPGTKLRGKGIGKTLTAVTPSTEDASVSDDQPPVAADRVLVMLATWTGPDAVTPELARLRVFGEADAWFREVSYGVYGLTGDVTPWLTIAGPDGGRCLANSQQVMSQAADAARQAGYDSNLYDRTVLYFPAQPASDCAGYSGWAYQPGTEVWLHGTLEKKTVVHEIGHNLGLGHAHAFMCTDGDVPSTFFGSTCHRDEYGDAYDAMGVAEYAGHFSMANKAKLSWVSGRIVDLPLGGGEARLLPVTSASGSVGARISTSQRTYWLERRTGAGADRNLPAGATSGLQLRVTDPSLGGGVGALDGTPDFDFVDVVLPFGSSWQLPEGPWISVGPGGDPTVLVQLAGSPVDLVAPGDVADLGGGVRQQTVTLTWTEPDAADLDVVRVLAAPRGLDPRTEGRLMWAGRGGRAVFEAPARGTEWDVLVLAVDRAGNESQGVTASVSYNKVSAR